MTTRQEVARAIQGHGPGVARQMFGNAIVTDLIVRGVAAPTFDCGGGAGCTCGGHARPAPQPAARPTYDQAALSDIAATLRAAGARMAEINTQYAAMQGRRLAARQASLRRGINVPYGHTFDHAAAERGRAAAERVLSKVAARPIAGMNARAAEFWAKQGAAR